MITIAVRALHTAWWLAGIFAKGCWETDGSQRQKVFSPVPRLEVVLHWSDCTPHRLTMPTVGLSVSIRLCASPTQRLRLAESKCCTALCMFCHASLPRSNQISVAFS
ncbi:hypothetical protein B0J14DRAFT_236633 [Halenospora varia]|nr:hypothetical protein B0J14DRAFT_236633 [Halenospora varia]